jgi:type II secretory pathway component PulF
MPNFSYSALDAGGRPDHGRIEALSGADAYRKLRERGLQPSKVLEEGGLAAKTVKGREGWLGSLVSGFSGTGNAAVTHSGSSKNTGSIAFSGPGELPRLTTPQLLFFTEELAELLDAGLQLEGALKVIEQRQERSPVKTVAAHLRQQVREGVSFSKSLRSCGRTFDPLYCNLVAAGESGGVLPQILKRQCAHLEMVGELGKKVTSALIYPAIVFSSAILLMFIFLTFLVPQLSVLLGKSGQKLPAVTQALITVSLFCGHWWWAILAFIGVVVLGVRFAISTPSGRLWWGKKQLSVPVVGPVLKARFYAEVMQNLSTLVSNGVTMLSAMDLMRAATGNVYLKGLMEEVADRVREGSSIASAMKRTGFFPPVLLDILAVGEQTGDLAGSLARAAKRYDRELTSRIGHLTTLIQPAVILIVALFVGLVAYSMISGILTSVNALKAR